MIVIPAFLQSFVSFFVKFVKVQKKLFIFGNSY